MSCACARSLLFGCIVGRQVGMVLPGWKAELEAEKAFEFGYAGEFVKTRAFDICVYLDICEIFITAVCFEPWILGICAVEFKVCS